jgi:MraZ protein
MFLGQYHHNLDSKDRLTVPVKFRDYLGNGMYFVQGFDHNLMVMPDAAFEKIRLRMRELNIADPDVRLLYRRIFGSATRVEADKVGRVVIPEFLHQKLGMAKELVLVGQDEYFEIWHPVEWAKQEAAQLDTDANNQRFKVLDLRLGSE